LPGGEIVEVVAGGGIGDFEVDGGVEKGCVPQVRGKHGECMLRRLPPFFDGFEGIDGKGMAQTMGHWWIEDDIAELLSWLSDADLSDGMVEEKPDLLIRDRAEIFARKQVWILILWAKGCTNREVVFHLLYDPLGKGDESIFSELGFLNVDRPLLCSIMVLEQMQRF